MSISPEVVFEIACERFGLKQSEIDNKQGKPVSAAQRNRIGSARQVAALVCRLRELGTDTDIGRALRLGSPKSAGQIITKAIVKQIDNPNIQTLKKDGAFVMERFNAVTDEVSAEAQRRADEAEASASAWYIKENIEG